MPMFPPPREPAGESEEEFEKRVKRDFLFLLLLYLGGSIAVIILSLLR